MRDLDVGKRTSDVKDVMKHPLQALMIKMVNNWRMVLVFYAAATAGSALIFSLVEDGRSYWDGLWWAFITALTIGYGDIYPVTVTGRITGIVLAHTVILVIVPLIIAHMTLRLIENRDAFTHEEQLELMADAKAAREDAAAARREAAAARQEASAACEEAAAARQELAEAMKEIRELLGAGAST